MKLKKDYNKQNALVFRWLITGCVLIGVIIIIGGITRLTQSGLSIVKWEPIVGVVPPLTEIEWNNTFELYKQTPEFRHYNSDFTLGDFKSIFFWEYLHRFIARLLGIVFLAPCIYFWMKGYFSERLKRKVSILFLLGCTQGMLGWFMVKSGLVDLPHVSHFRLAAHLVTAVGLMLYIYYSALSIKYDFIETDNIGIRRLSISYLLILIIQLIFGAFVAGVKGGLIYNTFPKMNQSWFPNELVLAYRREGFMSLFSNAGLVQFTHRLIAYMLVLFTVIMWVKVRKSRLDRKAKMGFKLIVLLLTIQVILGITTLLFSVPVTLGVLHQLVAILLILCVFRFSMLKYNSNPTIVQHANL